MECRDGRYFFTQEEVDEVVDKMTIGELVEGSTFGHKLTVNQYRARTPELRDLIQAQGISKADEIISSLLELREKFKNPQDR